MSDGMSDSRALGRLSGDLEVATYNLAEHLIKARIGHRGLAVDVVATINDILVPLGFRIQEKIQNEQWE